MRDEIMSNLEDLRWFAEDFVWASSRLRSAWRVSTERSIWSSTQRKDHLGSLIPILDFLVRARGE